MSITIKMKVEKGRKFAIVFQDKQEVYRTASGKFKSVSKELRKTEFIPTGATIHKNKETYFK